MSYLLIGSFWFQHCYVLWALAPVALLPGREFTRNILPWLTFGALFSNVAMDFLLNTVMKTSPALVKYVLVAMMIWGPMLLAIIIFALARGTKQMPSLDSELSYGARFEGSIVEIRQAGLSWKKILNKADNVGHAFGGFDTNMVIPYFVVIVFGSGKRSGLIWNDRYCAC